MTHDTKTSRFTIFREILGEVIAAMGVIGGAIIFLGTFGMAIHANFWSTAIFTLVLVALSGLVVFLKHKNTAIEKEIAELKGQI